MYDRLNIDWGDTVVDPLIGAGTDWLGTQIRNLGTNTGNTGNTGSGTRCPNQPADSEVARMLSWLPAMQLVMLSVAYKNVHGIDLPVNDPGEVGFAAYGGADCKVSTAAGQNYRTLFDNAMREYRLTVGDTGDGRCLPGMRCDGGNNNTTFPPPPTFDPYDPVEVERERQTMTGGAGSSLWIVGAVVLVALVLLMRR